MGIEEIFVWYQQKIGTYDKQLWETKIEQREQSNYGLNHVQMRSAKLNIDLIDLDLVRGSSFTKAKPQYGFFKVARMATLRSLFLPFYAKWWIHQTSVGFFTFIFCLYLVQLMNCIVYFLYSSRYTGSPTEGVSCMEIVIPILMAWILSLVHSQIVATIPDKKENHRRRPRKKLKFAEELETCPESKNKRFSRPKSGPFNLQFNSHLIRRKYRLSLRPWFRKPNADDDGFESLNGNGSRTSEEEIVPIKSSQADTVAVVTSTPNEQSVVAKTPIVVSNEADISAASVEPACIHCKRGSQEQGFDGEENSNCNSCLKCENWVKQLEEKVTKPVCSTDSDSESEEAFSKHKKQNLAKRRSSAQHLPTIAVNSVLDSTCDTENEALSSPRDWTAGVTTNSEDCSSDLDEVSDAAPADRCSDCFILEGDVNTYLNPPSVKASCTIYEQTEIKKADLSMLDISSIIISKVESFPSTPDYFYAGIALSAILALLRFICRLTEGGTDVRNLCDASRNGTYRFLSSDSPFSAVYVIADELPKRVVELGYVALGTSHWEQWIIGIAMLQRFILASMVFFLLAIAERTFKQRLLYAKFFSHLTSSRRARKSEIPHFRLNKVRNIKTWLSIRSYLKKRGPQRSVDVIVSTAFIVTLLLLAFLCAELLKETVSFSQYYLEALIWCLGSGVMLLRFMTLGTKINKKYRNLSVLITEQINLHLQIEQKPHKKDELNVANNVLKLAIDLLKELENPFKISGFSANPLLYNITKLVILSALSGVLSEMLGFKLKLHKIKLK